MNIIQQGIIALIRSTLTGQALSLPEEFDLETAYPQIVRHQIQALCYIGAVSCGIDKNLPVMTKLFQSYVQAMLYSERQLRTLKKLGDAFSEQGIDHLFLKGSVLKGLYPRPELRQMGDADILIRNEQYEVTKPVMLALGFEESHIGPYDYTWNTADLHVELHYRLASPADSDFLTYFGNGWQRAVKTGTSCCYEYSTEDHLIYLIMHLAKHYRDSGIGLKHAIDLWVYHHTYSELHEDYLKQELEQLHLWEFYCNVRNMLQVWFAERPSDEKAEFMTHVFFQNGAFGAHENFIISTGVRAAKRSGSSQTAQLRRTIDVLFPNQETMSKRYPVLKKAPILLSLMWIIRGARVLFLYPEKLQQQKTEISAATPEKITRYQQALHYVGLDFHFKED